MQVPSSLGGSLINERALPAIKLDLACGERNCQAGHVQMRTQLYYV
jgi:hypothetical protein